MGRVYEISALFLTTGSMFVMAALFLTTGRYFELYTLLPATGLIYTFCNALFLFNLFFVVLFTLGVCARR